MKIGPYQSGHGFLVIPFDREVCGSAARQQVIQLIDDVYYFLKDTEQYPVMNFENTRVGDKFIGAIMGKGAIPFVCLVDKVGEVEQVVITGLDEKLENDFIDGQVEYGEKLIPVINNCPSWAVDLSKKVAS